MVLVLVFSAFLACQDSKHKSAVQEQLASEPVLRHVVLFNFIDATSQEKIQDIEIAFASLQDEIEEIQALEWGINNSPEGLDKGFTHCFLLSFRSEADRDVYLPHPAHQRFVDFVGPYVEDVIVHDYWTR